MCLGCPCARRKSILNADHRNRPSMFFFFFLFLSSHPAFSRAILILDKSTPTSSSGSSVEKPDGGCYIRNSFAVPTNTFRENRSQRISRNYIVILVGDRAVAKIEDLLFPFENDEESRAKIFPISFHLIPIFERGTEIIFFL